MGIYRFHKEPKPLVLSSLSLISPATEQATEALLCCAVMAPQLMATSINLGTRPARASCRRCGCNKHRNSGAIVIIFVASETV